MTTTMTSETSGNKIFVRFYFNLCYIMLAEWKRTLRDSDVRMHAILKVFSK